MLASLITSRQRLARRNVDLARKALAEAERIRREKGPSSEQAMADTDAYLALVDVLDGMSASHPDRKALCRALLAAYDRMMAPDRPVWAAYQALLDAETGARLADFEAMPVHEQAYWRAVKYCPECQARIERREFSSLCPTHESHQPRTLAAVA
jgi:hypothetical protein